MMIWDTVIGLEVHAQLKTKSKLFSGSATEYGAAPNSQTSFIDAGLPGVLPVLNQEAVRMAVLFGIAIKAQINNLSFFERKNYFYPDLPKGYQISQFQRPIVGEGQLVIEMEDGLRKKEVHIVRAHLEEDAGKSVHESHSSYTGIDLNRAGTPLLEIVTSPCLYSAAEAVSYLKSLHQLLRFLNICDGNMQEGSFRCDVNISLKPKDSVTLGTRTELKNLNSFRFIEKAIHYEQLRHQECLETGQTLAQETRLYSPATDSTYPMRGKENENDYRYFPDPDLLPIQISSKYLETIKATLPALPQQIKLRLAKEDELAQEDIQFLLSSPATIAFYDNVKSRTLASAKTIVNWLRGQYTAFLNDSGHDFENPPISAEYLAVLLTHLTKNILSSQQAKQAFSKLTAGEEPIEQIIESYAKQSLGDDNELDELIQKVITNHPNQAADYRAGKEKLLGFFVGQVMKEMQGKADPVVINAIVKRYLAV